MAINVPYHFDLKRTELHRMAVIRSTADRETTLLIYPSTIHEMIFNCHCSHFCVCGGGGVVVVVVVVVVVCLLLFWVVVVVVLGGCD